jgi:hypothetical protein
MKSRIRQKKRNCRSKRIHRGGMLPVLADDGFNVSRATEASVPSVADVRKDIDAKRRLALQESKSSKDLIEELINTKNEFNKWLSVKEISTEYKISLDKWIEYYRERYNSKHGDSFVGDESLVMTIKKVFTHDDFLTYFRQKKSRLDIEKAASLRAAEEAKLKYESLKKQFDKQHVKLEQAQDLSVFKMVDDMATQKHLLKIFTEEVLRWDIERRTIFYDLFTTFTRFELQTFPFEKGELTFEELIKIFEGEAAEKCGYSIDELYFGQNVKCEGLFEGGFTYGDINELFERHKGTIFNKSKTCNDDCVKDFKTFLSNYKELCNRKGKEKCIYDSIYDRHPYIPSGDYDDEDHLNYGGIVYAPGAQR